jgi:hypothetical protein
MGFKQPNLHLAQFEIGKSLIEIASLYNDGWTSSSCKHELYLLKCWLDDVYKDLPTFVGEEKWEQERLIELIKK